MTLKLRATLTFFVEPVAAGGKKGRNVSQIQVTGIMSVQKCAITLYKFKFTNVPTLHGSKYTLEAAIIVTIPHDAIVQQTSYTLAPNLILLLVGTASEYLHAGFVA